MRFDDNVDGNSVKSSVISEQDADEGEYEDEEENAAEEAEKKKSSRKVSIVEEQVKSKPRKSSMKNNESKHRHSLASDKVAFAKTFTYKCDLDDATVTGALKCPSVTSLDASLHSMPSYNEGVQSLTISFLGDEESLDSLEASLFAEVLAEASDRLMMLRRTIDKIVVQHRPAGRILARDKHYCDEEHERWMFYPEDAEYENVVPNVEQKLIKDWTMIYNVFRKVGCELQSKNSFGWLQSEVNTIIDGREKEFNLEANLHVWLELLKKSQDLLKTREQEFEQDKTMLNKEIVELNAQIDSSYCLNLDKLDYLSKWEASKLEQQNLRQSEREESILNEIKQTELDKRANTMVCDEIQNYLKLLISNQEADITTWNYRYNEELERREEENKNMEDLIEIMQNDLEELRALQSQRQVVIDAYLEEQRKIQAEIDYWIDVNAAAARIQAHWKGYMVRHQLGPYKDIFKREKKKGKKGKKGKKKK